MLLADIDPIQIAIIVIAMVIGFVQWLWKTIKQGIEESQRANLPVDPHEKRLRDEAWRRQVQPPNTALQRPRPSPMATPPIQDPWGTVRDVVEKLRQEVRKAQSEASPPPLLPSHPPSPPPLPQKQPLPVRGTVRADLQPQPYFQNRPPASPPKLVSPAPPVVPVHVPHADPIPQQHSQRPTVLPRPVAARPLVRLPRPDTYGLRALVMTPASLRQAILLKEVLGPPKSLHSFEDSPI